MLRFMFGEPRREASGELAEAMRLMEQFARMAGKRAQAGRDLDHRLRKYEIWTLGLLASLDEVEQSHYASEKFRQRIRSGSVGEMSEQERDDYHRYLYFDKNAFIRLFSLLDKLGTFLNDMLELQTEKIKPHFSYFTVVRNMRENRLHPALMQKLNDVKERTKEPVSRLRKRRNTEIHHMNAEMLDDLAQTYKMQMPVEEAKLEDTLQQASDLAQGLELAIESLRLTFEYGCSWLRKK